jgi:hypothetical protein
MIALQEELPKKAEVVAKGQTQDKAQPPTKNPEENKPEETNDTKSKKTWSFKLGGELTNYFISESSAFFGDRARRWLETSLRLDGTVSYKNSPPASAVSASRPPDRTLSVRVRWPPAPIQRLR